MKTLAQFESYQIENTESILGGTDFIVEDAVGI